MSKIDLKSMEIQLGETKKKKIKMIKTLRY